MARPRSATPCWRSSLLVLTIPAVLSGCATNPVTGERQFTLLSEAQEIQIGKDMDVDVRREMGEYDDPALQRYVSDIGQRLAQVSHRPDLPWHFAVVDVPAVNAFALPGGYIYITRGILPYLDDEAELAGVLGHEIGHVTARHAADAYTRATGGQLGLAALGIFVPGARPFGQLAESALGVLFLKHGRDDELQSDRLGAEYAAKAGWDPRGVPEFLGTLGRIDEAADRRGIPNWLSTHPQPADRVGRIRATVANLTSGATGDRTRDREGYLRRVDGIIVGDNPKDGVVRGRSFLHPVLRFEVTFPDGWSISNGATQVVAAAPNGDRLMVLQIVAKASGNVRDVAVQSMAEAGFSEVRGASGSINGLPAYLGVYRGQVQGLGDTAVQAAHIAHGGRVYLLAGLSPPAAFDRAQPLFRAAIDSFAPVSATEADAIKPNRLDLYTARAGDTWASIAARHENLVPAGTLAVMNKHAVDEPPRAGERLKIVVGG